MSNSNTLFTAWVQAATFLFLQIASVGGYALAMRRFRRGPAATGVQFVEYAFGLGLFCTISLLVGLVPGGFSRVPQSVIMFFGVALLFLKFRARVRKGSVSDGTREFFRILRKILSSSQALWLVLPSLYYISRAFSAGVPQQHSDPLYYHLLAPRIWVELEQVRLLATHPSHALAQIFELVFATPMFWVGTKGVQAHVVTQIFGQWAHVIFGQVLALLLGVEILRKVQQTHFADFFSKHSGLVIFTAWLCTTQPAFEWLGVLAKNEYVILVFVFAAVLEAFERRFFWAGIAAGFAYSTKVLSAWACVCLVFVVPPRFWLKYIAGGAVAVAPFLFRNILWTKNPLFPNLDAAIGPHWLSDGFIGHLLSYGGKIAFDPAMLSWTSNQLFHKAEPKALLAVIFIGCMLALGRLPKRSLRSAQPWAMFLAAQLAFALLMLRPISDGRYAHFVAALWCLFGAGIAVPELVVWLQRRRVSPTLRRFFVIAAGVLFAATGLLINTPVDVLVKIPKSYLFESSEKYVAQFHLTYDVQKWLNIRVPAYDRVLFMAEKQHFYLDRNFETVSEMKSWEQALLPIKSVNELFKRLSEMGYRYVHFSPQAGGYPVWIRPYWAEIERRSSEAVFRSPHSWVFRI